MTRGGVRMLALVVVVSMLCAAREACAQGPFQVGRSDISGPFSVSRLRSWMNAVRGHEPGAMDVYATALHVWNEGDLAGAVRDFDAVRVTLKRRGTSGRVAGSDLTVNQALQALDRSPSEALDDETLKRAALLHTDIATSIAVEAGKPDWATTVLPLAWHLRAATSCVEWLRQASPQDPFVRQWYVSIAAFLQRRHEIDSAPKFIDRALSLFPSDRDLLMISGCVQEYLASARVQDASDLPQLRVGNPTGHLRQAERAYRQVIALGMPAPEISMRLGRVVGLLGRHDEALSVLKPVLDASTDVRVLYFTNLFIGEEEAALGHDGPAREAYQRAQALFPAAPSVHLALSRLARQGDDKARAAAVVRQMLAPEEEPVDPWLGYYEAGHRTLSDQALFDLRAPFRKARTQ